MIWGKTEGGLFLTYIIFLIKYFLKIEIWEQRKSWVTKALRCTKVYTLYKTQGFDKTNMGMGGVEPPTP